VNAVNAVTGRLVRREDLTAAEKQAMLVLLQAHFHGVTPERFERDLADKTWALLLEEEGHLRGFSTLLLRETTPPREPPCTVVYSGDTIVEQGAWATAALPKSWIAAVRKLREHHPQGRLWWLLLTSGFRTYRFLPVFWRDFWPRFDAETPPEDQTRMAFLAREKYGEMYREDEGVVRFAEPQRLREGLDDVPAGRLADPQIAFFLERNPGWKEGDELVCLTEIAEENLTRAGRRMWGAGERV
jgi:hypothetical protein